MDIYTFIYEYKRFMYSNLFIKESRRNRGGQIILYLIKIYIPGSNRIGQLPDDFFAEFTSIKEINLHDTRITIWPNFQQAHKLVIFNGWSASLHSNAPSNLSEIIYQYRNIFLELFNLTSIYE